MADVPAGPFLIVALAAVAYAIERLRDHYAKPATSSEADLERAVAEIAKAVRIDLGTSIESSGKIARLKTSFVLLRARRLVEQDPTLRDASRAAAWKASVVSSFRQIEPYLARKLGTSSARGPLFGGATDLEPPHLDLARFAMSRWTDSFRGFDLTTDAEAVAASTPTKSQRYALGELDRRRQRVLDIVWRAAGIEPAVWDPAGSLREPDLTELVDRRLRSIERLYYQASAGAKPVGLGSSNIERRFASPPLPPPPPPPGTDPTPDRRYAMGPIEDDFSVRPFEAPSVPEAPVATFIVATNAVEAARFEIEVRLWYRNRVSGEFDLDVWPGTRPGDRGFAGLDLPPQSAPIWTLAPDEPQRRGNSWILTPQGDFGPARIIAEMFDRAQNTQWFERSLLLPDGVFSALHIEALRHALLRRSGSDQAFDALQSRPDRRYDYVLGDPFDVLKHARVPSSILAPGVTDHFQNEAIAENELQVGDQLLFDVHPALFGLSGREYPTAMVTSIDPRVDGSATESRIRVQGFDTADLTLGEFQRLHVEQLDKLLDVVREYIAANAGTDEDAVLPWRAGEVAPFLRAQLPPGTGGHEYFLTRWRIFTAETFDSPGPWWIAINPLSRIWRELVPADMVDAIRKIPRSVTLVENNAAILVHALGAAVRVPIDSSVLGTIGAHFPLPDTVYVPLYEVEGGWLEYYRQKQLHPTRAWPARLNPVRVDPWVPKVARDANGRLRVLRPRLTPPTV